MSQNIILQIKNLTAGYGAIDVLKDISIQVEKGETVTVIGANTAGKSTLLRSISGLVPRISGQILYCGQEVNGRAAHTLPALGIAHVPEGRHIFPRMTVADNLRLGAYSARKNVQKGSAIPDQIFNLFPRLKERYKQAAGTLSGGEQQMVAIGRALMLDPVLLLLDEPSHGLAPIIVDEVHAAISQINKLGVSVLLVEQNASLALSIASRGYVLESGKIVLTGKAQDLSSNEQVRRAYLGI